MAKITVYAYTAWDHDNVADNVRSKVMATREVIANRGGTVIDGTALEIDESELDQYSSYHPKVV